MLHDIEAPLLSKRFFTHFVGFCLELLSLTRWVCWPVRNGWLKPGTFNGLSLLAANVIRHLPCLATNLGSLSFPIFKRFSSWVFLYLAACYRVSPHLIAVFISLKVNSCLMLILLINTVRGASSLKSVKFSKFTWFHLVSIKCSGIISELTSHYLFSSTLQCFLNLHRLASLVYVGLGSTGMSQLIWNYLTSVNWFVSWARWSFFSNNFHLLRKRRAKFDV